MLMLPLDYSSSFSSDKFDGLLFVLDSNADTSLSLKSKTPDNPIIINTGAKSGASEIRYTPIPTPNAPNTFLVTILSNFYFTSKLYFISSFLCLLLNNFLFGSFFF